MSRIFLSHSSADNFEALALRDWIKSEGWDDVFLDLDAERGIAAGERWERALHQAASRCEAVLFLISETWLASGWCLKEFMIARGLNKKLFAVLVDPHKGIADLPEELRGTWQAVNLVGGQDIQLFPVRMENSHEERHVGFSREGLRRLKRGLEKAGLDARFFAWPPPEEPDRSPYRGLKPLEAVDAGVFFGRDAPIIETIDRLRGLSLAPPPRFLVIIGASGAGKSSFLRAGLLPRLARDDAHFIPLPPIRPERAALTGENGLLGALKATIQSRTRAELRAAINQGEAGVRPMLAEIVARTKSQLLSGAETDRGPVIVIAVDQAEELFRAEGAEEGQQILTLLRDLTETDKPAVIVIFAIRSDSYDALEHAKPLEGLPQSTLPLLPMPRGEYREVIDGPARRLAEADRKLEIEPQLTQRLLEDIENGGGRDALPLLAFTLEQLYLEYQGARVLRLADYETFGGLKGAINAAVKRAFDRADADPRIPRDRAARETLLRRGLIPWLAGIDPDSKSPRRNIARKSDLPPEAAPLIDLLVEERLLSTDTMVERDATTGMETRVATIEPAHEALLRQWGLLDSWLAEDFGLLAALEGVKRAAREWDANARSEAWLAHQGQRLAEARALDARPDIAARLDQADRAYLVACRAREDALRAQDEQRRREIDEEQRRRLADAQALASANRLAATRSRMALALMALVVVGLVGWINQSFLVAQWRWWTIERPYLLTQIRPFLLAPETELALKPGDSFHECAKDCPEMIVVPAGHFTMGSPATEAGHYDEDGPQHEVKIAERFAVSKFDVTFADWDACVMLGGCPQASDSGMGRGAKPVIEISWDDARQYVEWFSRMTGKTYRLLTEAEWEYAARAGTTTSYYWGNEIGKGNANCDGCGSQWDGKGTSPVGAFKPNGFGLYDMSGNVWQWVLDCYHGDYNGAPGDGAAWSNGDCSRRVVRGGSWYDDPKDLPSASRDWYATDNRLINLGFRIARTLTP